MNQFRRTISLNENYFHRINSKEKAYFLGLLYADGNINQKVDKLVISLKNEDSYLLDIFCEKLNRPKKFYHDNKGKKGNKKLCICSKKICKDLVRLGCFPKKSLVLQFPNEKQVPFKYLISFILGYFDGDGSLILSKSKKYATIHFCGTEKFLLQLSNVFVQYDIYSSIYEIKHSKSYELRINDKKSISKFYEQFYYNVNFYLKRKKERFIVYFKTRNQGQKKYSKYIGVTFCKKRKKWKASISVNDKTINLGSFNSELKAFKTRQKYEKDNCITRRGRFKRGIEYNAL